jgi:hypothetical protein
MLKSRRNPERQMPSALGRKLRVTGWIVTDAEGRATTLRIILFPFISGQTEIMCTCFVAYSPAGIW